jgi:hypothetical protein
LRKAFNEPTEKGFEATFVGNFGAVFKVICLLLYADRCATSPLAIKTHRQ